MVGDGVKRPPLQEIHAWCSRHLRHAAIRQQARVDGARTYSGWIASTGEFASDLNDSLGNAAPFFEDGADLLRPLAEQEVAVRRVVRDTGRVFHAISREDGQLRGLITNGEATFSALASRDDALA